MSGLEQRSLRRVEKGLISLTAYSLRCILQALDEDVTTFWDKGDNYYMTGKRWRYKCNFNTQKAVEHFIAYNESIPKQQLKVDGNNIIINRTILGPAILTLKDGKLQGEELFGSETTFEKSTDVFKKSMAALLEKEKEEYKGFWTPQQIARKKSTVDNSKLEEALKAK